MKVKRSINIINTCSIPVCCGECTCHVLSTYNIVHFTGRDDVYLPVLIENIKGDNVIIPCSPSLPYISSTRSVLIATCNAPCKIKIYTAEIHNCLRGLEKLESLERYHIHVHNYNVHIYHFLASRAQLRFGICWEANALSMLKLVINDI